MNSHWTAIIESAFQKIKDLLLTKQHKLSLQYIKS